MAHVVQAIMAVPSCPVLTSNQAHAVAMKLREILNQPAEQQENSPVDFWSWLDSAYRNGDVGEEPKFTKYNMEVAYLAGQASTQNKKASD